MEWEVLRGLDNVAKKKKKMLDCSTEAWFYLRGIGRVFQITSKHLSSTQLLHQRVLKGHVH